MGESFWKRLWTCRLTDYWWCWWLVNEFLWTVLVLFSFSGIWYTFLLHFAVSCVLVVLYVAGERSYWCSRSFESVRRSTEPTASQRTHRHTGAWRLYVCWKGVWNFVLGFKFRTMHDCIFVVRVGRCHYMFWNSTLYLLEMWVKIWNTHQQCCHFVAAYCWMMYETLVM